MTPAHAGSSALVTGDIESAVAIRLCQLAAPGQTLAALLPCHDDPADEHDARLVADHFGVPALRVDLAPGVERLTEGLQAAAADLPAPLRPPILPEGADRRDRGSAAEVIARVRMTTLYAVASALEYLVAGSASRTTLMVGRSSSMATPGSISFRSADCWPATSARWRRRSTCRMQFSNKPRRAADAPDADAVALATDLERYLMRGPEGVAPARALRLERMIRASEHKRSPAPSPPHD